MALHVPRAPGFAQMLKEGVKHFSGLDEAVFRNIEACKELADTSRSTYGPFGMNKMVINHLEKLFVTNDSATMLRELEVEHPVARILVMAGNMQEQEIGDGTNLVIIFGGALLAQASELLHAGLSVPEVVSGFERACEKALELLPTLVSYSLNDERDKAEVARLLSPVLGSKQPGNESLLSQLVALACVSVLTSSGHFNVENICITKILGSSLGESDVVQGLVFKRDVETTVRAVTDAKIAIFSCPIDLANTETKGTVLLSSAAELKAFSRGEESHLDTTFSDLAAVGANVLVSGGKVSDMAIHFANKKGLMVVRLNSKWDLRRLCKVVGATALPMLTIPSPEQLGHCANVSATEIGETQVVMFKQGPNKGAISTILLRGSTENLLDDVERALDDAINTYKVLLKDRRLLPGAGATEMELARELESFGESCPGLQQYGIERFATALLSVPRALAENTGLMATPILARLQAAHQGGQKTAGVDVEGDNDGVCDAVAKGLLDSYLVKQSAIKLATSTATTILQIDQIIMAKKSGGPKPKAKEDWDKDDPTD